MIDCQNDQLSKWSTANNIDCQNSTLKNINHLDCAFLNTVDAAYCNHTIFFLIWKSDNNKFWLNQQWSLDMEYFMVWIDY
jgi:hypothetical protein